MEKCQEKPKSENKKTRENTPKSEENAAKGENAEQISSDLFEAARSVLKNVRTNGEHLADLQDAICDDFDEIMHRKCRQRIRKIAVDEETARVLRRLLSIVTTGRYAGIEDAGTVERKISKQKNSDSVDFGEPLSLVQSLVIRKTLPGGSLQVTAFETKFSSVCMKRSATNCLKIRENFEI